MRRIVVVLFSFLSLSLYAQQERFLHEIAVGANGGINFSQVSFLHNLPAMFVQLGDIGMRGGPKVGISARYISMKHFGVQLEINYIQGGWKERFRDGDYVRDPDGKPIDFSGVKISRRLDYIEIPFLSHIYFGKKTRFFVNVGPKLGILAYYGDLKDNLTSEQIGVFNPNDPRIYDRGHNSFDYGLSIGGGLDLQIGRLHTIVEGRYTFGFGDVYSNSKSDIYQRSNNQDVAVTVGFLLPVKTFYGD